MNTLHLNFLIHYPLVVCLLVLGNIPTFVKAQSYQPRLDSLNQALLTTSDPRSKVDIYNEISHIYLRKSDSTNTTRYTQLACNLSKVEGYWTGLAKAHLTTAEFYFQKKSNDSLALSHLHEGMNAAKQAKSLELQANAYKRIGSIYRRQGSYSLALQNYQQALQIQQNRQSQEGVAIIHNNIANVYSGMGNHVLGLDYMLKSLKYWSNNPDRQKLGMVYNNIGLIHMGQKNFSRALTYFFKSLEIMQALKNHRRIASTSNNLGITFKELKDYYKAQFYYQKALKIYQKLDNAYGIARVYHNLGVSYQITKQYEKALKCLNKSLAIRQQLNTRYGIASTLIEMGEVFRYLKQNSRADSFLTKGRNIARQIGQLDKVKAATAGLARLYNDQGKYQKAYEAQVLFTQLSDSLLNIESIRGIVLLDANYKFQQQKDSLRQVQNREKVVLQSHQINNRWWIAFLVVSVVASLLVILALISRQKNRRKQVAQAIELQQVKEQLLKEQLYTKKVEEKILQEQLQEDKEAQQQLQLNLESKDFELTKQTLYLLQKRQLLDKIVDELKEIAKLDSPSVKDRLKDLVKAVRKEMSTREEWQNFTQTFEMAHPGFFNRLQLRFPELTDNDLKLAALLRLGFDTKELAAILNITPDSVRKARTRLRKKLALDEETLTEFMREL